MKRALAVIAMSMFAASAAIADDAHEHSGPAAKPPAAAEKGAGGMQGMHEHMKTMEQSMSKMQGMMGCGKM